MFDTGGRSWTDAITVRLEPIALAALSLGAAAIHFGVISEHYAEYPLFGVFFSALGWFQALWAIAYVVRPVRWLAALAIAVNLATVAVWVWAHVTGLPLGPDAGHPEPTTVTDLMATLFEVLLIGGLFLDVRARRHAGSPEPNSPTVLGAVVVSALVVAVALGTTVALTQGSM
jgi:hypothetical protein